MCVRRCVSRPRYYYIRTYYTAAAGVRRYIIRVCTGRFAEHFLTQRHRLLRLANPPSSHFYPIRPYAFIQIPVVLELPSIGPLYGIARMLYA